MKKYGLMGKMLATPGKRDDLIYILIYILLEGISGMPGCLVTAEIPDLTVRYGSFPMSSSGPSTTLHTESSTSPTPTPPSSALLLRLYGNTNQAVRAPGLR